MDNKTNSRYLIVAIRRFLRHILSIKDGPDVQATIEGIKRDIGFRGPTACILIFSIFIASIGLNINSTAVIIGAMLISPLMGPILGIGLSIGTNDFETLIRSLKKPGDCRCNCLANFNPVFFNYTFKYRAIGIIGKD